MFDVLPWSFFSGRRGICPTCGASLKLEGAARHQKCSWCGSESTLERRLMRSDAAPEYQVKPHEGNRDADTKVKHRHWLHAEYGKLGRAAMTCPGCGAEFEADTNARTVRCSHCNTESRVERRLKRVSPETLEPPQRRNHADFLIQARGKSALRWNVETEQLCWRLLHEPDFDKQCVLANKFENWSYINATLAYFLPWLLELASRSDERLARRIHHCVGKIFCSDRSLWVPTLAACEQFAFNVKGSPSLLSELGLAKGITLKLLLDAAEYAWERGATHYACHAAGAVSTMISRNFGEHEFVADVLLNRMLYLQGPVLGWALELISSGYGAYVFRDAYKVLRFADDLAAERPEIIEDFGQPLRHRIPRTEGECARWLSAIRNLHSKPAKSIAVRSYWPPEERGWRSLLWRLFRNPGLAALRTFSPMLGDPELEPAAVQALSRFLQSDTRVPLALKFLFWKRGNDLPELLRAHFARRFPKTKLIDPKMIRNWQPPPDPEPSPEAKAAKEHWNKAIGETFAGNNERQREISEYYRSLDKLEVAVFDGPEEEAPTAPALVDPPDPQKLRQEQARALHRDNEAKYQALHQQYEKDLAALKATSGEAVYQSPEFAKLQAGLIAAIEQYKQDNQLAQDVAYGRQRDGLE